MPGPLDFGFVLLFAVAWPIYTTFVDWPRYLARLRAGVPGARMGQYLETLLEQWGLAAVAAWLWIHGHRPGSELGLRAVAGWRLGVALALLAATVWLLGSQIRTVATRPATRERLRQRLGRLDPLLPHSRTELSTFFALSVTAGVCEELLFRGFFIWALQPWLSAWGAGLLGAVFFGFAHAYQGRKGAVRAGIGGVVLTIVYLVCGSLYPVMVLHTLIDIGGGWTTWLALRESEPARPSAVMA